MYRSYRYIGPERIRKRVQGQPPGALIPDAAALAAWVRDGDSDERILTYTVGAQLRLRVADRHSEHVACAGQQPVLAAGELTAGLEQHGAVVLAVTNLSTGYCPEPACQAALCESLDRASISHPGCFSVAYDFRRCDVCGQRNVIKDGWLFCSCGATLSPQWNFA